MKVEGKVLGGGAFDWSKCLGNVVLVDFWATWCGPCVRDLPDLRGCYESYHDKGFEIVAISLDREVADVEAFAKKRAIPWTIIVGDGKPSPTVNYYGIMNVPVTVLVGKDGKVVAMNVTGETLGAQLEKLLGPVEEKKTRRRARQPRATSSKSVQPSGNGVSGSAPTAQRVAREKGSWLRKVGVGL